MNKSVIRRFFPIFLILIANLSNSISLIVINPKYKNINSQYSLDSIPISSQNTSIKPFIVGFSFNPHALDPVTSWDMPSLNVQYQVVEGLVKYDLSSHPNYEIMPLLAEYWIWENSTRISFKIRENIMFHDGTPLNATAVKWNFERLMYFCNVSGTLPQNSTCWTASPSELYYLVNGTYLFKDFESDGAYNFTINLNVPFSSLLDLLTFPASSILSPSSTPKYNYLNLTTNKIIGTGPFIYDNYREDLDIRFHAYDNYWRGKAEIEEMIWYIVEKESTRMNAGLTGIYDYVTDVPKSYIDSFRATEIMHVEDVGESMAYNYIEIYCGPKYANGTMIIPYDYQQQRNPSWLRRAMAISLNSTKMIEEILAGEATYGIPAIPRSMAGHNASVYMGHNYTIDNGYTASIEWARQIMKDHNSQLPGADISGWDVTYGGLNEADWTGTNLLGRNIRLNQFLNSTLNLDLNNLFMANWKLIGINCSVTERDWNQYRDTGQQTPWEMDVSTIGWAPDYLNPYSMIVPLFNLASKSCFSRNNDTSPGGLIEQIDDAVSETDYNAQLIKWMDLQSYIYDVRLDTPGSCTHIPTYVYFAQEVHRADVQGISYNVLGRLDFYTVKWLQTLASRLPGSFQLTSDAGNPDTDGNIRLDWTSSDNADNYSLYTYHRYISEINASITSLEYQNAISPYTISRLSTGDYYYIVIAYNSYGQTESNVLQIVIKLPKHPINLILIIGIIVGAIAGLTVVTFFVVTKKRKPPKPKPVKEKLVEEKPKAVIKKEEKVSAAMKNYEKIVRIVKTLTEDATTAIVAGNLGKAKKYYEKAISSLGNAKKEADIFNSNLIPMINDQIDSFRSKIHTIKVDKFYDKAISLVETANGLAKEKRYNDAIETVSQAITSFNESKEIAMKYDLNEYREKIELDIAKAEDAIAVYKKEVYGLLVTAEEKREKDRLEKEREEIEQQKKLIQEELQKRLSIVESLIKENKLDMALKNLVEIQKEAQNQHLMDIENKAEEMIVTCKRSEIETINRIKQTIFTLGARFTRLQLIDISEKSGVLDEALIESVIQDMIRNKEIQGEYFSSSKALAIEAAAVAAIPTEEKAVKLNVFISYSTLDTDHFQVSKIVRRLQLYPEINEVLFWEVDSKQNIVEFMEETLRKTNAFILFCSENSIKSEAVKGEWQSAYQMVKKGLMKIIPVYEDEENIPRLLWQMLNVKYTKDDFEGFIQKLYEEITR
ncbi:MAG: ABC transporter substrate-binding protein [Promethearchaeota archaeon]